MKPTHDQILVARLHLSNFVVNTAHEISDNLGFGWGIMHDNAPEDMPSLLAAWENSQLTGTLFPVWAGASDNTVYTCRGDNYAFRFWHDVLHCQTGKGMTLEDEVHIGLLHVDAVSRKFGRGSLEARLMYWDTVGQSRYCAEHGHFPEDQLQFVLNNL